MIWLTWRQFRTQAWVTSAALAVIALTLVVTGLRLAHLYDTSGIAACHAHTDCQQVAATFLNWLENSFLYSLLYYAGIVALFAVPAIIGAFWGAPLVTREVEAGTFRLAWNQSVSRTRWLAVKLGLVGLAAMATAGLLTLMVTWWVNPIQRAAPLLAARQSVSIVNRFSPVLFSTRGIAPVGYAAFAFALGVTAGVLIRRTVAAMAATLALFAGVQFTWPAWVRPHFISPVTSSVPLNTGTIDGLRMSGSNQLTVMANVDLPGAWVLSNQTTSASGQVFTGPSPHACQNGSFQACQNALGKLHLRQLITYQPASRYWAFQWYETAIFLALALALAGFCFWWIRRRRLA